MDIKKDIPFSKLTTLEIGGPIKEFTEVQKEAELISLLSQLPTTNYQLPTFIVIGGGSNLLVSDQGFEGLVIKNTISGIEESNGTFIVKAGTSLQIFVDLTIGEGFSGVHKLIGIPGSVGGAIYGNAGAGVRLGGDEENDGINNDVYENVIKNNAAGGIKFQRSPQGKICGNKMSGNSRGDVVGSENDGFKPTEECK